MNSGYRLLDALAEIPHALVDVFVRPLKILLPQPKLWWRVDNHKPYVVRDVKALGYWVGHGIAYLVFIAVAVQLAAILF